MISDLRRDLPPHSQAVHLCEQYTKKYRFQPIQIGDIMDDVLPFVYEGDLMRSPHKVAVLYFVFAAGSLMDPSLPPRNAQAQAYCELGLRALDLRNVSTSAEVDTVIAISLLASYHGNLGTENCLETAWEEMSLAVKVAQKVCQPLFLTEIDHSRFKRPRVQIGLRTSLSPFPPRPCISTHTLAGFSYFAYSDREPSRWNLEPQQVQKRRRLFWELMSQDGVRVSV